MSHYQRFNSKEPSGEFGDYLHNQCPDCSGAGWYYANGIPLCQVPCPTCKGTGRGNVNSNKLSKFLIIGLILLGLGFGICKLLNLLQ